MSDLANLKNEPLSERIKRVHGWLMRHHQPAIALSGQSTMCTESSSKFVVSDADRESILATAEIMADESLLDDVRAGIEEMRRGETIEWETLKHQLGGQSGGEPRGGRGPRGGPNVARSGVEVL